MTSLRGDAVFVRSLPILQTLAGSYRDWRRALLALLLPLVAVSVGDVLLLGRRIAVTGSPQMMIGLLMGGLIQTAVLTLSAVIASRAFRALADAVNRAPSLAPVHPVRRHRVN